jgi:hypothetical protein
VFGLDEDDEGEVSFGESSDAERRMTPKIPKAPSVKTFDDDGDFKGASDVDSGTLRAFVVAVIYANIAVLLVALGPMLWYFEGWSRVGPLLLAGGLVAGIRTYQTYRAWDRSRDEREDDDASGTEAGKDDSDPDDSASDESPPNDTRDPTSPEA